MKRILAGVLLPALAALMAFPGCSKETTKPRLEDPRKSIEGVMQELIDAVEARDVARYAGLFHPNEFRFVFDVGDVAGNRNLPPRWEWPEEMAANETLFRSPFVERLELDFSVEASVPVTSEDNDRRAFPEGTVKVTVANVELWVEMRDPEGGENIVFGTYRDAGEFFLVPDSTEVVDGVAVWKILEWRDRNLGPLAASMTLDGSWGMIKAYFAPYPLTTPRGAVGALLRAYRVQDSLGYWLLFDREEFLFVFDGQDVQENPDIPASWGWPEEEMSYRNLVGHDLVEAVDLDFTIGMPAPVTEADVGSRPFPAGTVKLSLADVDLTVRLRDPTGGEPFVYRTAVGKPILFLYPNPNAHNDGVPLWTIFEWRDERGAVPESDGTDDVISWGMLKATFQ